MPKIIYKRTYRFKYASRKTVVAFFYKRCQRYSFGVFVLIGFLYTCFICFCLFFNRDTWYIGFKKYMKYWDKCENFKQMFINQ